MANVPKIHELKIEDDVLKSSINAISQALNELEVNNDQQRVRMITAALVELLGHLTPCLEE